MGTIDVLHGLQRPPGRRTIFYQTVHNTRLITPAAFVIVPLVLGKIIADEVFLQADVTNAGIIDVGGLNLDGGNGIQLDAGMAVQINPIQVINQPGWLSPQVSGMTERMSGVALPEGPRVVFNLADLRVFGNLAAQMLRITYMQLVEVI
jgi:hypothetical protein